jgi:RNA polymerase sigma-70 factor (ECF subfamily)
MSLYDKCSDDELFSLLVTGDEGAFAEIYERYWQMLFRHAIRVLQDQYHAQDMVQDTFAGLWQKRGSLHNEGKLSSLLYKTLRNRIFDFMDYSQVREEYITTLISVKTSDCPPTDSRLIERELAAAIEKEISNMPARMRAVFELSRKDNLSYRQIASQLQISENTVKVQVSRALGKLQRLLTLSLVMLLSVLGW